MQEFFHMMLPNHLFKYDDFDKLINTEMHIWYTEFFDFQFFNKIIYFIFWNLITFIVD